MQELVAFLHQRLKTIPTDVKLWLAYSGGLDSQVLLHLLAKPLVELTYGRLHAIHVNHGLNPQAPVWAEQCQQNCRLLQVPLDIVDISVPINTSAGIEAAARKARYAAFTVRLGGGDYLITAHHQNDQAETLLLQLLRGSGVRGLAAMRELRPLGQGCLFRPLLGITRNELFAYAKAHSLNWVEDTSNQDIHFSRNFLRSQVLPLLRERWPAADKALTQAAKHCAEAEGLLEELAQLDVANLAGGQQGTLSVSKLLLLSPARRHNALRYWLRQNGLAIPETKHLALLNKDVLTAKSDAMPLLVWADVQVRRYRDAVYFFKQGSSYSLRELSFNWDNIAQPLSLPYGLGILLAKSTQGQGLRLDIMQPLIVRFRQGGERCQPAGRSGSHLLKKLMQEWGIPPWRRDKIPLLYQNGQLIAVVGYCICQPFTVAGDEEGWVVQRTEGGEQKTDD